MIVTCIMVYLEIGAVIWCFLDLTGVIQNTFIAKPDANWRSMGLATLMMIVCWPLFVASWLRGMWRMHHG